MLHKLRKFAIRFFLTEPSSRSSNFPNAFSNVVKYPNFYKTFKQRDSSTCSKFPTKLVIKSLIFISKRRTSSRKSLPEFQQQWSILNQKLGTLEKTRMCSERDKNGVPVYTWFLRNFPHVPKINLRILANEFEYTSPDNKSLQRLQANLLHLKMIEVVVPPTSAGISQCPFSKRIPHLSL